MSLKSEKDSDDRLKEEEPVLEPHQAKRKNHGFDFAAHSEYSAPANQASDELFIPDSNPRR